MAKVASDVLIRVQRTFGDEASVQVTDEDVLRWINDAQREIVMQAEDLLQTITTASTVANQQDYDVPANMFILRSLHFKSAGAPSYTRLKNLSLQEFDEYIDGWDGTAYTGQDPTVYCIYAGKIKLFPIPVSSGTDDLKIYFSRRPIDVVNDASTIDLPEEYFNAVVSYCLSKAFEMDEDWGAAANLAGQSTADVKRNAERHNKGSWETYPTISPSYDDLW